MPPARPHAPVVEAAGIARCFGDARALDRVDLTVGAGEVRALLGPNGAGKTTLVRILAGLVEPTEGSVRILGAPNGRATERGRLVGLVPSGDRSFYLRLSGLENLAFFARLHGLRRRAAFDRAAQMLELVDLAAAGTRPVGQYSHGMQKRLSVARALLVEPPLLLVDEATHDLDPDGARSVRELVAEVARRGCAVLWATQRLDEIRGFADTVTVLRQGVAVFGGSVAELLVRAVPRRFVVQVEPAHGVPLPRAMPRLEAALTGRALVEPAGAPGDAQLLLTLTGQTVLGEALVALAQAQVRVIGCRQERSEVEEAFFSLIHEAAA